jgi:hypothetical protein
MKWIEAPLGVVKMEDWYNVTGQQVKKQGGSFASRKPGS